MPNMSEKTYKEIPSSYIFVKLFIVPVQVVAKAGTEK